MQFNYRPVPTHQRVLHVKLSALWQDLRKLFERVGYEIRLTVVMTGKRMSPLDGPVDVVGNVGKERASIPSLKVFENSLNVRKR
jgi:hypothetical protein